ncbi:MAG: hypothetical protein HY925_02885 [Elusimicrobia bacterium]|nr:hypothetical protein [Elusimicrobiota bacterium]
MNLLLAALLALPCFAQEEPVPTPSPEPEVADAALPLPVEGKAGWVKARASLLLYDSSGTLVNEVGLGTWEESGSNGTAQRKVVTGGVSVDGRFAWAWEKVETIKLGKSDKALTTARLLRYLGTEGQELFRNELADAPKGLDPVSLSNDGEWLLLTERGPDAWIIAAYDFMGNRLVDAHGKGSVELAQLTSNGQYALVRWHQLDLPPEYTLLKVGERASTGLPALKTAGVSPKLTDDGRVLVGAKVIFPAE